ncbi:hypothetical protein HY640_04355 [Candidatus Woesearchaeota archaeon]|nr:hypothetical protein [Candidatus Woesearchaeota archaeon]
MTTLVERQGSGLAGISDDPIAFFRKEAKKAGLGRMAANLDESCFFETDGLYTMDWSCEYEDGWNLNVEISYSTPGTLQNTGEKARSMPPEFKRFLAGTPLPNGNSLRNFNPSRHDLDFFGQYAPNLVVDFRLLEWPNCDAFKAYPLLEVIVKQPKPGIFSPHSIGGRLLNCEGFLEDANSLDYRPFVRRTIELFQIADLVKSSSRLEEAVDRMCEFDNLKSYVALVFPESEAVKLKGQMDEVYLKTRGRWASVPKLSLGIKQLPDPGANLAGYIAAGAPLLVEYLSSFGILSPVEARAVVAQKVANYVLHHTGFQRSPSEALRILEALR